MVLGITCIYAAFVNKQFWVGNWLIGIVGNVVRCSVVSLACNTVKHVSCLVCIVVFNAVWTAGSLVEGALLGGAFWTAGGTA